MAIFSSMRISLAALLSFNGGFVDTADFLGLQGLFTAHVTGNFVTLAATLVMGSCFGPHRWVGHRARGLPALPILLMAKVCFLLAFFVLAVALGPFPDSDAPAALLTGFAGVAGTSGLVGDHRKRLIGKIGVPL